MDLITKSSGLHFIIETIFANLDSEELLFKCQDVNGHWKKILRNPRFWFKKCEQQGLFKENSKNKMATKFIQAFCGLNLGEKLTNQLIEINHKYEFSLEKEPFGEFHSFVYAKYMEAARKGHYEMVKVLAPLFDNPNAPHRDQSFTSLMADLYEDIKRVSSFIRYLNGTFP